MNALRCLPTVVRAAILAAAYVLLSASLRAEDPKAEVRKIEEQLSKAVGANDLDTISKLLAPDWKLVAADGSVLSRDELISVFKSGKLKFTEYRLEGDFEIRIYGDAAVVIGSSISKGSWDQEPFDDRDRFTDVFAKINGEWRCVSSHSSTRAER